MPFDPPEQFNLADWFLVDRLREGSGDRVALRTGARSLTYAEVDRLANRYGTALRALGVRQEERVLVAAPDGPDFVGAVFGAAKIGAVVVMVNPDLARDALAHVMAVARPPAAVVGPEAVAAFTAAGAQAGRTPALLVTAPSAGHATLDDLDTSDDLDTVATHRDDPAVWLFSGGTTGRPKIAVQPHRSFANTTVAYAHDAVGYAADDRTLSVPKLYFGYALGSNLLFPFSVGACAVLYPEHPTAEVVFDQIRRHRPTILVNVPRLIADMVDHPAAAEQDLSCLRFATSAGEALPPDLHRRWTATFGVELLDGLGTAEMWHIFCSNLPGAVRPGTLGRAVPGFEIAVRDDDGRDVGDGEVGRLWVRGGSRALGYWQDLDTSAAAFVGEWFAGGDLVRRDGDGYLSYVGRGDDALKVGGRWLAPAEVEGCLLAHPAVTAASVVGAPDRAGLVKPVAFVVAQGAGTGEDLEAVLQAHVLAHLEAYKHPRRVFVMQDLPRTHLGKVNRAELKRLAAEASSDAKE
jgi:benzoate-CoA ligase family protein